MARFRGHLRFAAAFCVLLALSAAQARAGSIVMILTVAGAAGQPILLTGPFLNPGSTPDNVTINTVALNAQLITDGSALQFSALGATSNNPGAANAVLTQTGTAFTTGAAVSFTLLTEQTQYTSPVGSMGTMTSSASNTYTNATVGDNQTFQSWFDQTNTPAKTTPSPILGPAGFTYLGITNPQSDSATATPTALANVIAPYALLNQTNVSLAASTTLATDQFQGSTTVVASSIPEPTSLALLGIGMTGFLALRRLLKRTSAA
jgi:hypothetical protein